MLADNLIALKQAELMIDGCAGVLVTGALGTTESSTIKVAVDALAIGREFDKEAKHDEQGAFGADSGLTRRGLSRLSKAWPDVVRGACGASRILPK
ncbi:hypothetical protein [Brevundimonas sp. NPDC046655]|uniref:hypothetical protein n=1 Tax=unclassified Brevundimonas TaxID=2622653 RepID=UPI00384EBAC4